jgi:hypothetical protein
VSSLMGELLGRAQSFLVAPPSEPRRRLAALETVVMGMSAGCGVTTVARGLSIELDVSGDRPAHLLTIQSDSDRIVEPEVAGPAAVVWDVAAEASDRARPPARRADTVVLVAGRDTEPALAELVVEFLQEELGRVMLVANRVRDEARWSGRAAICLPESRLGAVLLARRRRPGGAFGTALRQLAALVEGRA